MKHCDDIVDDYKQPDCLRWYIFINRLPAHIKMLAINMIGEPKLFADHKDKRVRVVMASRLGDVGISYDLTKVKGYSDRVSVSALTNFSDKE